MKILYQCEICRSCYESLPESLRCEAKGTFPAKYQIGEIVYKKIEYPGDDPIYVEAVITGIEYYSHRHPVYNLDRSLFDYDDEIQGRVYYSHANEWQLYRIGDKIDDEKFLALDDATVDPPSYICERD